MVTGKILVIKTTPTASIPERAREAHKGIGSWLLITITLLTSPALAAPLPSTCFNNVADYTHMWWAYGLRDPRGVFCIQTSRYGLVFDHDQFILTNFGPILNPSSESDALVQDNSVVLGLPAAALECILESNGTRYRATSAGPTSQSCKIAESGKYFQRRILDAIYWANGTPSIASSLELSAWPDRVCFTLHITPNVAIVNGAIEVTVDIASAYSTLLSYGEGRALSDAAGRGFVFLREGTNATLTADATGTRCTVRLPVANWAAGTEHTVGLIIYPAAADAQSLLLRAVESESSPILVGASQQLPVTYDRRYGWHYVALNEPDNSWPNNNRMERVFISIQNTSATPRVARLNFGKETDVYSITGVSAILRDQDQYPTGIPIQLSKDWHGWVWWHALTMLTVPAQTTITFEYTSVNAHWGGVAAASHSQLSLVGYGGNQLWDQAALGSWGESITFDPDVNLGRSMIDDIRPLMVWAMQYDTPTMWTWTNNVGGGDFLVYYDQSGAKQWNSRMRTMYRRYCPVLTEVSYAGQSQDGKIDLKCTANLYRTDDLLRVVYRLRYDVNQTVNFSRLAFFQVGADNYNDHQFNLMARGNESGLIEEWAPPHNGASYNRAGIACPGEVPWFSLHDGISRDPSAYGAWANRGLVIRSWQARLAGQNVPPYATARTTTNSVFSVNLELSPPPGLTYLLPGDYVDAVIVQLTMPQYADEYYGPNAGLSAALSTGENTWRMVHREAVGNDLDVQVLGGVLEQTYPIRIRSVQDSCPRFTVAGGLGYVPITISGLSSYRNVGLQRYDGADWTTVDQTVHGKDYWQTDYDVQRNAWELSYSVPLDTLGDVRQAVEFRLNPGSCNPPVARADFDADGDVDQSDFARLQRCFTGTFPATIAPGCHGMNLNDDSVVDQADASLFVGCMSGANMPAQPGC